MKEDIVFPYLGIGEDIPLLSRFMFEQRMNIRHLIPILLDWAKEKKDTAFFEYLLKKSTIADVRDWIDLRTGMVSRKFKELVNDWLYSLSGHVCEFWYHKYSTPVWHRVFDVTHPRPDSWKLKWFQGSVYGDSVPDDSLIARLRDFRKTGEGDLVELLKEGISWHYLSQSFDIGKYLKTYIEHAPLGFIINKVSDYTDNPELIEIALSRLEGTPRLNVANILTVVEKSLSPTQNESQQKLRMRLLEVAQRILDKTYVDEDHVGRAAIIVDKSGSMQNAIELGVTIAGLLSARLGDKVSLYFFDTNVYESESPESVLEMLQLRHRWKADAGTEIRPVLTMLANEPPFDTVVIVSDGFINDYASEYRRQEVLTILEHVPPMRWIFVKIGESQQDEVPAEVMFKEQVFKGIFTVITPEAAQDIETVLGVITYFQNKKLIAKLQGIREDLIVWADSPVKERSMIEFRVALKCGNCGGPAPPDVGFCLFCGMPFKQD